MPHLLAYLSIRYIWTLPADVKFLPDPSPRCDNDEREGAWYIWKDVLHYCWEQEWKQIKGIPDGFAPSACTAEDAPEFSDD